MKKSFCENVNPYNSPEHRAEILAEDHELTAEQQRLREHPQRGLVKSFAFDGFTTQLVEERVKRTGIWRVFGRTKSVQKEVTKKCRVFIDMVYYILRLNSL